MNRELASGNGVCGGRLRCDIPTQARGDSAAVIHASVWDPLGVEGAESLVSPARRVRRVATEVRAGSGLTEADQVGGLELRVRRNPVGVDGIYVEGGLVPQPDQPAWAAGGPKLLAETTVLPLTTASECEKDMEGRFTIRPSGDSHDRRKPKEGGAGSRGVPMAGRWRFGSPQPRRACRMHRPSVPTDERRVTYSRA